MALHRTPWPLGVRTKSVPTLLPPTLLLLLKSVPSPHLMKIEYQSLTSPKRLICLTWVHMIARMAAFSTHRAQVQWWKARSDQNQSVLQWVRPARGIWRRSYLGERKAYRLFPTPFLIQIFRIRQAVVMTQMKREEESEQGAHLFLQASRRVEPAVEGLVSRYWPYTYVPVSCVRSLYEMYVRIRTYVAAYMYVDVYVHAVVAQKFIILFSLLEKYLFRCIQFLTVSFINLWTIKEPWHLTAFWCDPTWGPAWLSILCIVWHADVLMLVCTLFIWLRFTYIRTYIRR